MRRSVVCMIVAWTISSEWILFSTINCVYTFIAWAAFRGGELFINKIKCFFLEHSSRVSRKIYSFELCSNIVYDIFNLFVGDYRPWLKYAYCRWRAREIMFNCIYADRWCIFSSNCFIQKELNTLNWYAFSSFIIHTLNAWSLCRSTGMWLNWISLNYIALWFVNELERNYLLIYNSSTGTWWPTETVWRSLCRRLDYPNAALQ